MEPPPPSSPPQPPGEGDEQLLLEELRRAEEEEAQLDRTIAYLESAERDRTEEVKELSKRLEAAEEVLRPLGGDGDNKDAGELQPGGKTDGPFNRVLSTAIKTGWMHKMGRIKRSWTRRFFVLHNSSLTYYTDAQCRVMKGCLSLNAGVVRRDDSRSDFHFFIDIPGRTLQLSASNELVMNEWIKAIREVLRGNESTLGTTLTRTHEKSGWISKEGKINKSWKRRFFVLFEDGMLSYYRDETAQTEKGSLSVRGGDVRTIDIPKGAPTSHNFQICTRSRILRLAADTPDDMRQWMQVLQNLIDKLLGKRTNVKVLFVGLPGSGKTTLLKQMKILFKGYTEGERLGLRSAVYSELLRCIQQLLEGAAFLGLRVSDTDAARRVSSLPLSATTVSPEIGRDISTLWKEEALQAAYKRRREFELPPHAHYFLEDVERTCARFYVPNYQDIIRAQILQRETWFDIESLFFRAVTLSGRFADRKRWGFHFSDASGVVFVVSLASYDEAMEGGENSLRESLLLWDDIASNAALRDAPLFLIFTMRDVFSEKLQHSDMVDTFPSYSGGSNVEQGVSFLRDRFVRVAQSNGRTVETFDLMCLDGDAVRTCLHRVTEGVMHLATAPP